MGLCKERESKTELNSQWLVFEREEENRSTN